MISRYEAYMDGIALSSIDPSICVLNITPGDIGPSFTLKNVAGRDGSIIAQKRDEKTSVTIEFEIHEYDIVKRQRICQLVQLWADGSVLKTSDRPEQRLKCVCEQYPVVDAKHWTNPVTMTFAAYNPPYWEEENPVAVSLSAGTSGNASKFIPGNVKKTAISAVLTAGAGISAFSVTANGNTLSFTGLSLSSGDIVTIDHDEYMNLRVRKGTTSLLGKRTGSSADDLTVDSGKINTFSFTASASASVVFTAKGWWK